MGQRGRPRHPELLTPREQDVLALLRDDLTNEQIAERLGISFETAKHHAGEILAKLGVSSREEAAAWRPEERASRWPIVGRVALAGAAAAVLAGLALLAVLLFRSSDNEKVVLATPNSTVEATPTETSQVTATDSPKATTVPTVRPPLSVGAAWSDCPTIVPDQLPPGVHVMDAQTCQAVRISDGVADAGMTWSPDESEIAFLRFSTDSGIFPGAVPSEVVIVRSDGTELRQLTDTPDTIENAPKWSPDGSKIAYTVLDVRQVELSEELGLNQGSWTYSLVVQDPSTAEARTITADLRCILNYRWAADSRRIFISSGCDSYSALHVTIVNIDDGSTVTVPNVRSVFAVQPTGEQIAYACETPTAEHESYSALCIGPSDGSTPSPPISTSRFPDMPLDGGFLRTNIPLAFDAIWTNDGSELIFVGQTARRLFILPEDGGNGRTIDNWTYEFMSWASGDVLVTSRCLGTGSVPCGPYGLTSYDMASGETRVAMTYNCGAEAGLWSPTGSRIAVSTAQIGGCI